MCFRVSSSITSSRTSQGVCSPDVLHHLPEPAEVLGVGPLRPEEGPDRRDDIVGLIGLGEIRDLGRHLAHLSAGMERVAPLTEEAMAATLVLHHELQEVGDVTAGRGGQLFVLVDERVLLLHVADEVLEEL